MNHTLHDNTPNGRQVQYAADWFYYLVAITIVVMGFGFAGWTHPPAFGLAAPLILVGGAPGNIPVTLTLIAIMSALLLGFIAIGVQASHGSRTAFTLGLVLYALDTLLMLGTFDDDTPKIQLFGGIIWHIIALLAIGQGLLAANRHKTNVNSQSDCFPVVDSPASSHREPETERPGAQELPADSEP